MLLILSVCGVVVGCWHAGGEFPVHIYVGENLTETVVRQCTERGVSLQDSLQARDYASKQMQAEGLLPIQEYPITIDGQTAPLTVFSGETPEAALLRFVRRFQVCETNP